MAIELQRDGKTGEILAYRTHSRKDRKTDGTGTEYELLGGLYPLAEDTERNREDIIDKAEFQRLVHNNEVYEQIIANYEKIDKLQQQIIDTQGDAIKQLKKGVKELISHLKKYEDVSRWTELEDIE